MMCLVFKAFVSNKKTTNKNNNSYIYNFWLIFVKLQFDQLEVDWLKICRILYDDHLVKDDHF